MTGLDDDAMLAYWRELERLRRRVPAAEHALVLEAEARGLPDRLEVRSVAAAQASGEISDRQARAIVAVLDRLPDAVAAEHGVQIETDLVGYCTQFDPHILAKLGERIVAYYDPDAPVEAVQHRDKHRDLTLAQRVDGSSRLTGELTAEATELLLLHLDALAKPRPEIDGVKDPRTARATPPRRPARGVDTHHPGPPTTDGRGRDRDHRDH
ncbi:MAG: DUF222 domain-containing protein, partial [Jatrophihabitans sp.]|uniref:DUF222 domain-containing protein n=1 Tax=Jatrophihabitans sp. TaxID=1932789 RepID=UPI003911DB95